MHLLKSKGREQTQNYYIATIEKELLGFVPFYVLFFYYFKISDKQKTYPNPFS